MSKGNTEFAKVTFWGTRGSIPTPGRMTEKYGGNTPCVSIIHKDINIIIDAGSGIRNLGIDIMDGEFGPNTDSLSMHLFISHTHWDHIQGMPFFSPMYSTGNKFVIYGSPNKERFLESILRDQMDSDYFPVGMQALGADLSIKELSNESLQLGEVTVDWQEQVFHPGGSVRYRFNINGKKIVYASDVEIDRIYYPEKMTDNLEKMGKEYLEFIDGADLLIADGQYTEDEYTYKSGWGHTSIPVIIEAAYRAGVKQVAMFHHDPVHSDKFLNELWAKYSPSYQTANPPMNVFWAREGLTMPV
jgi:phosphoribosyl 1,2-cyclic phosphodiesterase